MSLISTPAVEFMVPSIGKFIETMNLRDELDRLDSKITIKYLIALFMWMAFCPMDQDRKAKFE
ncbi:hypothetical protein AWB76_01820 [Caballeronia temeraria]|uniref:Uncharacterized protein n=1 Tax=Caballeronia temeraria TaxID=1777137 RepID=A0A158A5Z2_9BURK|nr:hypothetical protein AWB76_01820 [Caballeronia temeraria]